MRPYDIAVIGGGASGLAAAVMARRMGASVAVLERGARVGRKLLATGNGRCNLTNTGASPADYHGEVSVMAGAMAAFPPGRVMEFFESLGLLCLETYGGRVFPLCDQAAAVLDALRFAAVELGGEFLCGFDVKKLEKTDVFKLTAEDGRQVLAKCAILATGGPAAPSVGGTDAGYALFRQLGHRVTRVLPALTQLETRVEPIRALKGIRIDGGILLKVDGRPAANESGDILFTEYGLSGTAVMAVSRCAAQALASGQSVEASLCVLEKPYEAVHLLLRARKEAMPRRALEDFLTGVVNKRLGQTLIKAACAPTREAKTQENKAGAAVFSPDSAAKAPGAAVSREAEARERAEAAPLLTREAGTLTDAELRAISRVLTDFRLPVTGTRGFAGAQASAGGADAVEFSPDTLMSRKVRGLFACGEALDIDGDCGGFNLQWAWASGLFAAQSAARTIAP